MPTIRKIIFILSIISLIGIINKLYACTCIGGQRTVKKAIKHSDVVFVGTVLNKQIIMLTDSTMLKMFSNDTAVHNSPLTKMVIAQYNFLVQGIYKGKIKSDTLTIYTGNGGGDCGIRFEIGKRYIVYGENETYFGQVNNDFKFPKGKNIYWTYICLRTMSYSATEINQIEKYRKKHKVRSDRSLGAN